MADSITYTLTLSRASFTFRAPAKARVTVYDMDTLASAGEFPNTAARGAAVDQKSGHGFCSSKPVVMWDTKTLTQIKTIDVDGRPDGIMEDPFNQRVYVFSHSAPNATVIDANDGKISAQSPWRLPGASRDRWRRPRLRGPRGQGPSRSRGRQHHGGNRPLWPRRQGRRSGGLAMDAVNHILFVACHDPQAMVILDANTGKVITSLHSEAWTAPVLTLTRWKRSRLKETDPDRRQREEPNRLRG